MTEEGTEDYISDVLAAKKFFKKDPELAANFYAYTAEYKKPLRIYLGTEQDLYSEQPALRAENGLFGSGYKNGVYDYVIGSTHAFLLSWGEVSDLMGPGKSFTDPFIDGIEADFEGASFTLTISPKLSPGQWKTSGMETLWVLPKLTSATRPASQRIRTAT